MKNSIMKKTWGILLGFGLSLATAAFVLTGCVVEEDDPIAVSLKVTSVGNAVRVEITSGNAVWDSSYITAQAYTGSYGVRGVFDFTLTPDSGVNVTGPGNPIPTAVSGDDTKLDFVYTIPSGWSGTAKVSANGMTAGYLGTYLNDLNGNSYVFDDFVVTITHDPTDGVPLPGSGGGGGGDDDDDDDTTGGTAQGLADALAALLDSNQSAPACDVTGTTVAFKANKTVTIPTGITVTVPTGVTLTVAQSGVSGAKITLSGGTLEVDGILSVQGGDLVFSSTASTIKGEGVIEKNSANGYAAVSLATGNKLTIKDVTVKGITTGTQSQPVISVPGTAELTLDGAVITGNKNTSNGGGISISGTAKVTLINDAEVKGNTAAKGGGVYINNSGELHIEKGTVYGTKGYASPAEGAALNDEDAADKNTATASNGFGGAAIYLATADTRVYGGEDDAYEITATEGEYFSIYFTNDSSTSGAAYTDKSIRSNTNGVYSKAAR